MLLSAYSADRDSHPLERAMETELPPVAAVEAGKRSDYAKSAAHYEEGRYRESPHMSFYLEYRAQCLVAAIRASTPTPAVIVDVGCGTGVNLTHLKKGFPGAAIIGIDLSEAMLKMAAARAEAGDRLFSLSQGSAFRLPFADQSLDALVSTRFIHQFPHPLKIELFREFKRVVRPGGCLAVEFYSRPYAMLQYRLPAALTTWRKPDGPQEGRLEEYLDHYPSRAEVREIAGPGARKIPVRASFCRIFYRALGPRILTGWTRLTRLDPFIAAYSEYLVVRQN
jgi:ubiquinone/menaquinone biosynthesis C-methylase UbiE